MNKSVFNMTFIEWHLMFKLFVKKYLKQYIFIEKRYDGDIIWSNSCDQFTLTNDIRKMLRKETNAEK